MPVADLPPGEWTLLLIGDQWPTGASVSALSTGTINRRSLSTGFAEHLDRILTIKHQNIAPQQGVTAEDIRSTFDRGAAESNQIAHANDVKSNAYSSVHDSVAGLRSSLTKLAEDGNSEINNINSSGKPLPVKVAEILGVVTRTRDIAFSQASACVGHISDQIRAVLNAQGIDTTPQAFASAHGVSGMMRTPSDRAELERQITNKLEGTNNPKNAKGDPLSDLGGAGTTNGATGASQSAASGSGFSASADPATQGLGSVGNSTAVPSAGLGNIGATTPDSASPPASPAAPVPSPLGLGNIGTTNKPAGAPPPAPPLPSSPGLGDLGATNAPAPAPGPSAPSAPGLSNLGATTGSTPSAPNAPNLGSTEVGHGLSVGAVNSPSPSATPSLDAHAATTAPSAGNPIGATHTPTAPTPGELAQSFNSGNQTGAPMSASAEAISSAATSPVHSAPPPFAGSMSDAGVPAAPAFESAHAAATPPAEAAQVTQAPTAFTQPVVASPTAPPINPGISAAPPVSAGPLSVPTASPTPPSGLLAYGADLRPAAASVPAAPSMPPAAAPGSAPVNPASGSSPTGQPAVVRQQPSAAAAQAGLAAGLTERALAATATGAAVAAGAAHSAAKERLQRLLEAVARQQPKLNWAIGNLEDGTTLLTTDLAGGWIPPGIEIPTGVRLLTPAVRTGDLEKLLGPAVLTAAYRPGQYLPPAKDAEPVSMSIRARDTTAVEDLGWELAQATKWRDGLPRLAHTLAKAVSAKSGHLDSEVELLGDYLNAITRMVVSKYPDNVIPAQVGNWQLLATINALVNDEKTLANYHFAWFQAQVLMREGKP